MEDVCRALSKMKSLIESVDTPESLSKEYNKWAKEYDRDVAAIGHDAPPQAAQLVLRSFSTSSTSECKILDIACGTGLVGQALRGLGFKGMLHGVDASENMIAVARDRGIYDDLFVQHLSPAHAIKISPPEAKYNAVICTGAFTKNHLKAKLLLRMTDILVSDGILVFSVHNNKDNAVLFEEIQNEATSLTQSKVLQEICVEKTSNDVNLNANNEATDSGEQQISTLHVYCLRKL